MAQMECFIVSDKTGFLVIDPNQGALGSVVKRCESMAEAQRSAASRNGRAR